MATSPTNESERSMVRVSALASALNLRTDMYHVLEEISTGSLSLLEVLAKSIHDEATSRLYVVKALESIPMVGKIKARRVMAELGITQKPSLNYKIYSRGRPVTLKSKKDWYVLEIWNAIFSRI